MGRRGEEVGVARAHDGERKNFEQVDALRLVSPLFSSLDFSFTISVIIAHVRSPMRLTV